MFTYSFTKISHVQTRVGAKTNDIYEYNVFVFPKLILLGMSVVENCNSNIYINTFLLHFIFLEDESAGCVDKLNSPVNVV